MSVKFLPIKIISKKLRGNKVDLLTREITLKMVCGNNMNFSNSEITSKKSIWQQRGFFDQQNYIEKLRENDVKIRRNLILDLLTRYQC